MPEGQISPWFPEQDRSRLAALGKMAEEAGELAARASRCIIHGIDEIDPDSGRTNRQELEREIADICAAIFMVEDLRMAKASSDRVAQKLTGFREWQRLIAESEKEK